MEITHDLKEMSKLQVSFSFSGHFYSYFLHPKFKTIRICLHVGLMFFSPPPPSSRAGRSLIRKEHNSKLTVTYPTVVTQKSGKQKVVEEVASMCIFFYITHMHMQKLLLRNIFVTLEQTVVECAM